MQPDTRSSEFPVHIAKRSDDAKRRWLSSNEAVELMSPSARKRWGKKLRKFDPQANPQHKQRERAAKVANKAMRQCSSQAWWDAFLAGTPFPPSADHENCRVRKARDGGTLLAANGAEGFGFGLKDVLWPSNYLTDDGRTFDVVIDWVMAKRKEMAMDDEVAREDPADKAKRKAAPRPGASTEATDWFEANLPAETTGKLEREIRYYQQSGLLSPDGGYF